MDNQPLNTELQQLADLLESKKQAEAAQGLDRPEKELFREVLTEHIQNNSSVTAPVTSLPVSPTTAPEQSMTQVDQARLEQFVQQAFTKGLMATINEVRAMNNAYLLDRLHDRLADEYYQKLVEAKQVNLD